MYNSVVFQPWRGSEFGASKTKLMILGESHYGEPCDDPKMSTINVVEKWRSGEWSVRYLTSAARLFTGKERWEINRQTDLNPHAFYNFVQTSMPDIGIRPSPQDFRASHDAFREVLACLRPTHVLVTGSTLWNNMPEWDGAHAEVALGGTLREVGEYRVDGWVSIAMKVPHLSRFFSASRWAPVVDDFRKLANVPA